MIILSQGCSYWDTGCRGYTTYRRVVLLTMTCGGWERGHKIVSRTISSNWGAILYMLAWKK